MTAPVRASSWVPGAAGSGYDADNLPYGVFSVGDDFPRVGVRIADFVIDLAPVAASDMMSETELLVEPSLRELLGAGHPVWTAVRHWLTGLVTDPAERSVVEPYLVPLSEVSLQLPFAVADYIDFYCSLEHASNIGKMFRPDAEPLLPNWRHLPVGYHGRAGTVVASGTDIKRPSGQRKPLQGDAPTYGPSQRLDVEAELGFVIGTPTLLGNPVSTADFAQHVFGVTLLNDWSARDIQAWEYVPLGPFLGKSFATSISPWITPLAALESARIALPGQEPEPLPYLRVEEPAGYDIDVTVRWNGSVVSNPPYASMYWSPAQMLAHLTSNGASLRTGDLFASGTISGAERDQRGSFLELSWGGRDVILLSDGSSRTFLEDGDEVALSATAPGALGGRIALGDVTGRIRPAVG